jgi:predicted metal-dependent HD superfamily phosphohydrolase
VPELTRWCATWTGLGVTAPDENLFGEVIASYREPHRHYHTTQHLDECFAWLDGARRLADHLHEVELALWFHDAVYHVRMQDNEERSASWLQSAATNAGVSGAVVERVRARSWFGRRCTARSIFARRSNQRPETTSLDRSAGLAAD